MTQNHLDEGGIFEISGGNLEYYLYAPAVSQISCGQGIPKYTMEISSIIFWYTA